MSKIASGFKQGVLSFFNGVQWLFSTFINGDALTKLSYLIMGAGCFLRGQIVKGLLFLAVEVVYFYYMIRFGLSQLALFPTLGIAAKKQIFSEQDQMYLYVQGDNSMLILLFGVVTIVITLAFIVAYVANIRASAHNTLLLQKKEKLPSFREDFRSLFDKNLHLTFMSLPGLGLLAFTILPLIFMLLIAFTNYDRTHQPPGNLFTWVGFENFSNIFWKDPLKSRTFFSIFIWTLVWAFFATFLNYLFGMILALMINKKDIKLKKFWRTIFVTTIAIPQFVSLLLMSKLLDNQGPLNAFLISRNIISTPIPFLTNATLARISVIVVNLWVGIPYTMLITSGILMNIPADLYESARIDGASVVKTFTSITLPYMLFITTPYLITQFMANINNFNVIYLLTSGNPLSLDYFQAGKTDLLVTWLYKQTVSEQNYNLASTIGIFIFAVSAVLSLIVYNLSGSVKKEEEFQ